MQFYEPFEWAARAIGRAIEARAARFLIRRLLSDETKGKFGRWNIFQLENLERFYQLQRYSAGHVEAITNDGERFTVPLHLINPIKLHIAFQVDEDHQQLLHPLTAVFVLVLNEQVAKWIDRSWRDLPQYFYNRRAVRVPSQFTLLKHIVEISLDDRSVKFTSQTLASTLLNPRLARHPNRNRVYVGIEQHLRALAAVNAISIEEATGETPVTFGIGQTAIADLEKMTLARTFEARDRNNKYLIVLLTVITVLAAVAQTWVANNALGVAADALAVQRAQLALEHERDQRAAKEKLASAKQADENEASKKRSVDAMAGVHKKGTEPAPRAEARRASKDER